MITLLPIDSSFSKAAICIFATSLTSTTPCFNGGATGISLLININIYSIEPLLTGEPIPGPSTTEGRIVVNFNYYKSKEIMEFFNKINPYIQKYLSDNSIDILFNDKNVVIGKDNLDITSKIITIIDNEIN